MGLLSWLRGNKETAIAQSAAAKSSNWMTSKSSFRFVAGMLQVDDDFFGPYNMSPNGRYVLVWRDATDDGRRGGARESGFGTYKLFADQVLVAEGKMQRPNDGKVADNGTFILNDWLFSDVKLGGVFYAFRSDGSQILSRQFEANLYNNGLSTDGRRAASQTCTARNDDSSLLTLFDLETAGEIAGFVPQGGWAKSYEFGDGNDLCLIFDNGRKTSFGTNNPFPITSDDVEDEE